ncbi:DUF58 domain-containing protein [Aphanothece sacrum]|uniref:Uncharacterized protein n=1 Tax=Aphanothece sacrum FPU1 TaxID=1920663 RepID=A0A401IBQ8_APHSA|nr:DUF58 domain-containing protein [Aphanothece sacrum]GBF78666.1 hypothetical protein AsFPU1_0055 [Aphanothece sacrum FPU1]GBF84955.1 hypothetical protein AsFPU3_2010 [Aphanothece sacrum FPU3]
MARKPSFPLVELLENHWATPAYSGWLLAGLALCFFGAATNTMAGWLYVMSGVIVALLGLGAVLPVRSLNHLSLRRLPISPVSAGDDLTIELIIENREKNPKTLLQVRDLIPHVLGNPQETALEVILPQKEHPWTYYIPTQKRGIYRWHDVELRTGTPLGLFWCRRSQEVPSKAVVYPQVLPLTQCPLVDTIGQEDSDTKYSDRNYQAATEGVTKALRPYRYGDPMRLIHWRTSARFEEFKVRELEIITGGEDLLIGLDNNSLWHNNDNFEQAVIAAASLYFYANYSQLNVKLWTANTGVIQGNRVVLETLAEVEPEQETKDLVLPSLPIIWLTENRATLDNLPKGSRWLIFPEISNPDVPLLVTSPGKGLIFNSEQPLQIQLQKPLR